MLYELYLAYITMHRTLHLDGGSCSLCTKYDPHTPLIRCTTERTHVFVVSSTLILVHGLSLNYWKKFDTSLSRKTDLKLRLKTTHDTDDTIIILTHNIQLSRWYSAES